MATKKSKSLVSRATKTARGAAERVTKSLEGLVGQTEKLRDKLEHRAEETAEQTRRRAAKLSLSVIDLQKTTFDNAFRFVSKLQTQSENAVQEMVQKANWVPAEGKGVVKEWVHMLRSARGEFQRTVDKSFDLLTDYFERIGADTHKHKAHAHKPAAKPAAKKKAKKKAGSKKKAAHPTPES